MLDYQKLLELFLQHALWPLGIIVGCLILKKPLGDLLDRTNRAKIQVGQVQLEVGVDPKLSLLASHSFEVSPVDSILRHAMEAIDVAPPSPSDITPEEIDELPEDLKTRVLSVLLTTALEKLEFNAGIPLNSLQRNVDLFHPAFTDFIDDGQVFFSGVSKGKDKMTFASLVLDEPTFCGPLEIVNYTAALLGALNAAFGADTRWELIIGVIAGRPDSAGRVGFAQNRFAPASRNGRVRIILLEESIRMQEAVFAAIQSSVHENRIRLALENLKDAEQGSDS